MPVLGLVILLYCYHGMMSVPTVKNKAKLNVRLGWPSATLTVYIDAVLFFTCAQARSQKNNLKWSLFLQLRSFWNFSTLKALASGAFSASPYLLAGWEGCPLPGGALVLWPLHFIFPSYATMLLICDLRTCAHAHLRFADVHVCTSANVHVRKYQICMCARPQFKSRINPSRRVSDDIKIICCPSSWCSSYYKTVYGQNKAFGRPVRLA